MIHYFAMLSSNMIFDFYFFFHICVSYVYTSIYVCVCAYAKVNNKNEKKFKNCMKSYMLLLTYSLNKRGIE